MAYDLDQSTDMISIRMCGNYDIWSPTTGEGKNEAVQMSYNLFSVARITSINDNDPRDRAVFQPNDLRVGVPNRKRLNPNFHGFTFQFNFAAGSDLALRSITHLE
jgi:hypothetical protein